MLATEKFKLATITSTTTNHHFTSHTRHPKNTHTQTGRVVARWAALVSSRNKPRARSARKEQQGSQQLYKCNF
jgi:hypothetical protein